MSACNSCHAELENGDRFCATCGTQVTAASEAPGADAPSTVFCHRCGSKLLATDRFCAGCGEQLDTTVAWRPSAPTRIICVACDHFRKAKAFSSELPHWNGTAISQALLKIREEEHKHRSMEAKEKASFMKLDAAQWDRAPAMTDYCAAGPDGKTWICELKNRSADCGDFEPRSDRFVECSTCSYLVKADPNPYPAQGSMTADHYVKAQEAVDAEIALEIAVLNHAKGRPDRSVKFHDFCTFHSIALPYVNIHHDCSDYRLKQATSGMFAGIKEKK